MSLADEFLTDAGVKAARAGSLSAQFLQDATPAPVLPIQRAPIEAPGFLDNLLAKIPSGLVNNSAMTEARDFMTQMAAPGAAAAQMAANVPGIAGIKTEQGPVGTVVNQAIMEKAKALAAEKKAYEGQSVIPDGLAKTILQGGGAVKISGGDLGAVLNPANLMMAAKLPVAAGTIARAGQGAAIGGAGSLLSPVEDGGDNFWLKKGLQGAIGGAVGAVATPILGKVADVVTKRLATVPNVNVDDEIAKSLRTMGHSIDDIPPAQIDAIRAQVQQAAKKGENLDPAALLRKSDFEAAGLPATTGQLTRDSLQYAKERNLRGVAGVGEPIQNILDTQNQGLQSKVGALGEGASENYYAAKKIANALKEVDDSSGKKVTSLYTAARNSAGKDLEVPLSGLAQDYASTLDRFADKIPQGVQNQFNALGLDPLKPTNQQKTFSIEGADKLLKAINDHQGSDISTNRALTELRNAVKKSVIEVDATGGPFAPAVAAARERFAVQDATPALKAAATGDAPLDSFVKKFVLAAPTDDVKNLVKALGTKPEAMQEAKSQVGEYLSRAAFGENVTGDKNFVPERFAKAIRDLGTEKLNAFYTAEEVAQLKTLSRVGAYINSPPGSSPVNFSNTGGAVANMVRGGIGLIPGGKTAIGLIDAGKTAANNRAGVATAIAGEVPVIANVDEATRKMVARLMAAGVFGSAGMANKPVQEYPYGSR